MEFLTIFLAGLLGLVSPAGFVVERIATDALRDPFESVESLAVRVDNTPNYQLLSGHVDRVRIAGRGLYPLQDLRIAALDIETDEIAVDPASLRAGRPQLQQPLDAGIRLVLTREDLNRALQSPELLAGLQDLNLDFLGAPAQQLERYDIIQPQIDFLDQNRLRAQVRLQSQQSQTQVAIEIETGLQIVAGRQLQLVDPVARIDGNPLPAQLVNLLVGGISQQLDLALLEERGITARVLQWQLTPDQLELAAFVRVDPKFTAEN
jgi:LmeA-like phospholipid-binding